MNLAVKQRLTSMHKTSVYLVVGLAFICVAVGGGVGPLMSALFFAGMIVSWFVDRAGIIDASFAKWWNLLILGFVGVTLLQIFVSEESIISAALRFVLLLSLVKLFGRFSARDDLQLYALSFLLFAAATAVNEGVTYGILFALYVFAGTFSLALFHLTCEFDDRHISATSEQTPFDRQYMAVLGGLSLVIFLSSMAIFFVFPRVGLGFFISQSRDQVDVTGFSESVELGSHGTVRDNPEVVMRVEFPDGRPEGYQSLHWRTMTFDHYDGKRWSQTIEQDSEDALPRSENHYLFHKRFDETRRGFDQEGDPIEFDVYLEPLGTNLLPRLWPTGVVRLGSDGRRIPWDPNNGDVTADAYSDIRHTIESEIGVIYGLTKLPNPNPTKLRAQRFSDTAGRPDPRFVQLPEGSERLGDLAREATADAESPYEKAEAVAAFLQQEYSYTTDLPEVDQDTPVDSFLFDTKRGHCEYFATAATLLLRSQNVPTRVVNGFLGGNWNGMGGYLAVRQGDAHSWIEVWVPGFGWAPVDPTPAAEVLPTQPSPLEQWYRNASDTVRMNWMKWVIEYDLHSQIGLLKKMGKMLAPKAGAFGGGESADKADAESSGLSAGQLIFWLGLGGLGLAAVFSSRRAARRRRRILVGLAMLSWPGIMALWMMWFRGFETGWATLGGVLGVACAATGVMLGAMGTRTDNDQLRSLFERIEAAASSAGVDRPPDEGPGAFLARLAREYPGAADDLVQFRRRYLRARFGGKPPGPAQIAGVRRIVERIRKTLRKAS